MASTLNREFATLERVIEKYCREDKKEKAFELVTWALEYAHDFPEKADIDEAITLVKKAETYMSEEGKPHYKQASERVVTKLLGLLKKKQQD